MDKYPVTVKNSDVFLHGTSIKNYLNMQSSGFLKHNVRQKNWGISNEGVVCFQKWVKENEKAVIDVVSHYCYSACKHDNSTEGIILKITGKELKKFDGKIFSDPNVNSKLLRDSEGLPIGVDSNWSYLSIVVESDVPIEYLKVYKKVSVKE